MTATLDKVGRKTDLDRLNELIDWYEKFKPESGLRIPLAIGPLALAKMIGAKLVFTNKKPQSEYDYRGRVVYATGIDKERGQS